jgi:hypothetical protein
MFNLKTSIEKLKAFNIYDNLLFYNIDNNLYVNNKILIADVEGFSFWKRDNYIFYNDLDGNNMIYFTDTESISKLSFRPFMMTLKDDEIIGAYDYKFNEGKFEWKIGKFFFQKTLL